MTPDPTLHSARPGLEFLVEAIGHQVRTPSRRAHAATRSAWEGRLFHAGRLPTVRGHDSGAQSTAYPAGVRLVRRGQALYRANDVFTNLYIVNAGSLKTVMFHSEGREQISDFPLFGDLLGLDGLGSGRHACDAIALEDSQLCVIPFLLLEQRCRDRASVQHRLHRLMGAEIAREQKFFMLLGRMCADERLADFLTNLSRKLSACGYSPHEFTLRMTREDIGNHLGLKLETVSRAFSRFQAKGYVAVQQKRIMILDYAALHGIASGKYAAPHAA